MADIDKIINDYYKRVYKICLFYLGDKQDAEEAAQQIFIKIIEKLHNYKEEAKLFTWIYRITINTLNNIIRRKKLVQFISLDTLSRQNVENPDRESDPATLLESQESKHSQMKQLEQAINILSLRERTAFYLYYYEQLKQKEIAEIMGTSVSAVESLIHKSKNKIKKRVPQDEF